MSRVSVVFVLVVGFSLSSFGAKHPVSLEKNVTDQKCLECHAEKTKGKFVHSAISGGCFTCHEVRVNRDVTRIKLTTATPVKLCLQCHSEKAVSQIKGRVHSPAVRDCIKCHDAHTSANKNQLLKPAAGATKDDNLCLQCHSIGSNTPEKGSRHAALDMGCDTCHVTHKSGDRGQRQSDYHLAKETPALCLGCHDVGDEKVIKAHQGQPFAKSDCLTCHDPHQSKSPKLMQAFLHQPFADKSCDTCHQPAKDGKLVLTQATAKEICVTCHAEKTEQIEKARVQHAGAAGDCVDCHNPHAGSSPGFPKPNAVAVCLGCHNEQMEQAKKAHVHQPAFEQGCATCHEPHGGENARLLRAKNTNTLCLECHGPEANPQKLEAEHLVAIFNAKVRLPENYFVTTPVLPLKYQAGHPVDRHPVSDLLDPADPKKVVKQLNCLTCHQAHASSQSGLLAKDVANNADFCKSCHTNVIK